MQLEKQKQILDCMSDVLSQNGFRAQVLGGEAQPLMLRVETQRMGKISKEVVLENCFIPIAMPSEDVGLMQFYITIFTNIPDMYYMACRQMVQYINDYSALGSFGLYQGEESGQIFLKHNTILDASGDLEKVITFIADNISVLLASVTRFIDALGAVAYTGIPIESAVEQDLLPRFDKE